MTLTRRALLADGGPALMLLVLAALLPAVASSEYVLLAASMIVTALVAVSFNLLFGYTGMFSFGQAAFYGLGAYATVLLMNEAGLGLYLALVGAVVVAVAAGAVSGAVLVRMEPVAFIMLTFALGALLEFAAEHSPSLTGGDSGLIATSLPQSLNVVVDVNGVYYRMLAIAAVVLAGVFVFVRSRAGLILGGFAKTRCAHARWASRWSAASWACSRWRRASPRSAAACRCCPRRSCIPTCSTGRSRRTR